MLAEVVEKNMEIILPCQFHIEIFFGHILFTKHYYTTTAHQSTCSPAYLASAYLFIYTQQMHYYNNMPSQLYTFTAGYIGNTFKIGYI